jgi:hypothetical protein
MAYSIITLSVWHSSRMYIQYIQGLFQSRLGTAYYALVISRLRYHDNLDTWTVIHMTAAKFKHQHQVKVKLILRPTVCLSIHLGIRHPPGTRDQFFPFSIFFWQFRVYWCGAPSLTRSRVSTFQSQSHITTDNQSASSSWWQAPIWDQRPIFLFFFLIFRSEGFNKQ